MPISIVCPSCSTRLKAPDRLAGAAVRCPKCSNWAPVSAAPSGHNHYPERRRGGGGCAILLLCLSLLVNVALIGGFFYLGFTHSLDRVAWFWDRLPLLPHSPEGRVEEIVKEQIKATNELAEAIEKEEDAQKAMTKFTESSKGMAEFEKKVKDLGLSDEERNRALLKVAADHHEEMTKAQTRLGKALAKRGLNVPNFGGGLGGLGGGLGGSPKGPAESGEDLVKHQLKALKELATSLQEITDKAKDKPGDPAIKANAKASIDAYEKKAAELKAKVNSLQEEGKKGLAAALKDRADDLKSARDRAMLWLSLYPPPTPPNLDPLGSLPQVEGKDSGSKKSGE